MFSYIDPDVRKRLIDEGKLFRITREGERLDAASSAVAGRTISLLGPIPLPLDVCGARLDVFWYAAVRNTELAKLQELADELRAQDAQASFATLATSMAVNSVLVLGDPAEWHEPLVRVHSSCLTGDVFGSLRCECGPQLHAALDRVNGEAGGGLVVYMAGHEGRGIGLWAKAATYLLQDGGEDTYEANRSLGLPDDSRDFSDAAALLRYFVGERPIRLLTNNPKKVEELELHGLSRVTRVPHVVGINPRNRRYLEAKKTWGHQLDIAETEPGDSLPSGPPSRRS